MNNVASSQHTSPAVMLDLLRAERERRSASASLYEFVQQAWPIVEPGVPFIGGWHIEQICEHLEACSQVYSSQLDDYAYVHQDEYGLLFYHQTLQ